MAVNAGLISTMHTATGYPVTYIQYTGDADEYITFDWSTGATAYADGTPAMEQINVTLDYYCPLTHDALADIALIKSTIFTAYGVRPSCNPVADTDGQHYAFDFATYEVL